MPHVNPHQVRKLGSHVLSRDGVDLTMRQAPTAIPMACFNFALTGLLQDMNHPTSPDSLYHGNGIGQVKADAVLSVDPFLWPQACFGLQPSATLANHPGCGAELVVLNADIAGAVGGDAAAQARCAEAMVGLVARRNGLIPGVASDRYQLHMASPNWFSWEHFALSFMPTQPGLQRIFVQTITGVPLAHACNTIWDETLPIQVTLNVQELHATQVALVDSVTAYGTLCVKCGAAHGQQASKLLMWHRCRVCGAVYCYYHGYGLTGTLPNKHTRNCEMPNCLGRTQLIDQV